VNADLYQASTLNLLLPKGFKLELVDKVLKDMYVRENHRR